jgi:hypothetical protein
MAYPEAPANLELTILQNLPPLFKIQMVWKPVKNTIKYRVYASLDDPDYPSDVACKDAVGENCVLKLMRTFELVRETTDNAYVGTYLGDNGVDLSMFYVTAVDENGNESPPSNTMAIPDPSGLVISPSSGTFAGSVTVTISNIPPGGTALYTYTPNGDANPQLYANPTPYIAPFVLTTPGTGNLNVYLEAPGSSSPTWAVAASFTINSERME